MYIFVLVDSLTISLLKSICGQEGNRYMNVLVICIDEIELAQATLPTFSLIY